MPFSFWFIPAITTFIGFMSPMPNFYFSAFGKYFFSHNWHLALELGTASIFSPDKIA
jgi:hypothetical protein